MLRFLRTLAILILIDSVCMGQSPAPATVPDAPQPTITFIGTVATCKTIKSCDDVFEGPVVDGLVHKYGDFVPECWQPGTITFTVVTITDNPAQYCPTQVQTDKCCDDQSLAELWSASQDQAQTGRREDWHAIDTTPKHKRPNWIHRHPVGFMLIMAGVGGGGGYLIHRLTDHTCPNYVIYEGKKEPYDGTPPCPGPGYDPGGDRVYSLRIR